MKKLPEADIQEKGAEQLSQEPCLQSVGNPCGEGGGKKPCEYGGENGLFVQQAVLLMGGQSGGGGGRKYSRLTPCA